MRLSDATARPTDRQLRQFALIALVALVLLAGWRFAAAGVTPIAGGYFAAAAVLGFVGLCRPRWLVTIFTLWMIAVFPIAWLVSHLVLAVIYFALLTPLGLVFRLCGRDILDRKWPGAEDSYWRDKPTADKPTRYLRQF